MIRCSYHSYSRVYRLLSCSEENWQHQDKTQHHRDVHILPTTIRTLPVDSGIEGSFKGRKLSGG